MEVVAPEPIRTGTFVWQPRPDAHVQTVVCKVTFDLAPGEARIASTPLHVAAFDQQGGSGERRWLAAASDFVPFKARAEVLVTGSAFAPGGRPVRSLLARVAVAELDKVITVHGDRHFAPDGSLSDATPFAKMPLSWDRAAGGPDTANPAGVVMGPDARPDGWGRIAVPNLEPAGALVTTRADIVPPIGFGPLSPMWPTRRLRLHRYAAAWDPLRWTERPLPPDFDSAYFQTAPPDQWVTELLPDARILLENLHPQVPQLSTRPARFEITGVVETAGATAPLRLRCDTLLIDTDRQVLALVYRAQIPLQHPQQQGRVLLRADVSRPAAGPASVPEGPRRAETLPLGPNGLPLLSPSAPGSGGVAMSRRDLAWARNTLMIGANEALDDKRVLPFAAEEAPPTRSSAGVAADARTEPASDSTALPFRATEAAKMSGSALGRSMRLQPAREEPLPPPPPPPEGPPASGLEDTDRPPPPSNPPPPLPPLAQSPLPEFRPPAPAAPSAPLPAAAPAAPPAGSPVAPPARPSAFRRAVTLVQPEGATALPAAAAMPFERSAAPAPPPSAPVATQTSHLPFAAPPPSATPAPPPTFATPAPIAPLTAATPPELSEGWRPAVNIVPLRPASEPPIAAAPAVPGVPLQPIPSALDVRPSPPPEATSEDGPVTARAADGPATGAHAQPPSPANPPEEAPLPLDEYPLERCARIRASLGRRPEGEPEILEAEQLAPDLWKKLEAHWKAAISAESRRGKSAQGRAYDQAYVAQLESERGPIGPAEYARLTVAVERGTEDGVLADMQIPSAGLIRVQRVWLQRILTDPRAAQDARAAVRAARESEA